VAEIVPVLTVLMLLALLLGTVLVTTFWWLRERERTRMGGISSVAALLVVTLVFAIAIVAAVQWLGALQALIIQLMVAFRA